MPSARLFLDDLPADPIKRGLQSETRIDANNHQIQQIRKRGRIFIDQDPPAPRDVGVRSEYGEQCHEDDKPELGERAIVGQQDHRDRVTQQRQTDDKTDPPENVIIDRVGMEEPSAQQFLAQLRSHRTFDFESLFIEIFQDDGIETVQQP
ncbi:hypothetical protein [Bradyrhizobium sp. RDM4]|uniref:hypothetical protein n=1 Tax=Bradyrhizobium sp. RDM4 TaxID=3378765 RepID=UPI0038FD28F7